MLNTTQIFRLFRVLEHFARNKVNGNFLCHSVRTQAHDDEGPLCCVEGHFQLGDNFIQFFSVGEVYRRIYGRKFCFTASRRYS